MTLHTQSLLSLLFDDTVAEVFFQETRMFASLISDLYGFRTMTGPDITTASLSGLGPLELKPEGQAMTKDQVIEQFKKTFVAQAYGKLVDISREVLDDERWGFAQEIGILFASAVAQREEIDALGPFNDAPVGATYKGEDGLSLANAAHVNVDGGNSQSNTGTNALDSDGVKAARTVGQKWTSYEADERLPVVFDEILTTVDQADDALTLVTSTLKPGSQNNDNNIYQGLYKIMSTPYLNDASQLDTDVWFLMASARRRSNLLWYDRIPPELLSNAVFDTQVRQVGMYRRYINGFRDWRWVHYNNPA